MLGDLEDRFNSLEEGSKGMVAEVNMRHNVASIIITDEISRPNDWRPSRRPRPRRKVG